MGSFRQTGTQALDSPLVFTSNNGDTGWLELLHLFTDMRLWFEMVGHAEMLVLLIILTVLQLLDSCVTHKKATP